MSFSSDYYIPCKGSIIDCILVKSSYTLYGISHEYYFGNYEHVLRNGHKDDIGVWKIKNRKSGK